MAKVSAASSNGGARPEAAVISASADHSSTAPKPISVALCLSPMRRAVAGPRGGGQISLRPAALDEQPRAAAGAGMDGVIIGRFGLAEHDGALRVHDHHAAQHAGRLGGVFKRDDAARAKPAQRPLHRLARAPDRLGVEGAADLREIAALADHEAVDGDGSGLQRQLAEADQACARSPAARPAWGRSRTRSPARRGRCGRR